MRIPHSPVGQTERSTGRVAPIQNATPPRDFIGPALSNLGNTIQRTGNFFLERQQQTENLNWVSRFNEFKHEQELSLLESGREAIPGSQFSNSFSETYEAAEKEFIKEMPERLQDDFQLKLQNLRQGLGTRAIKHEFDLQDQFSRERLSREFELSKTNLQGVTTPEGLEVERFRMQEVLDNTSLPAAEKLAIQRKFERGLEQSVFKNAILSSVTQSNIHGPGSAARVGAASIVDEVMNQLDVPEFQKTMTDVERADYVQVQLEDIEIGLEDEIENWDGLSQSTKEVTLALAFLSGDVPESIMEELEEGDLTGLGKALEALDESFGLEEQLTPGLEEELLHTGAFANVPYETRLALKADAEAIFAAEWKQDKAAEENQRLQIQDQFLLAAHDGMVGQADLEVLREAGVFSSYDEVKKAEAVIEKYNKKNNDAIAGYEKIATGNPWADTTQSRKQLDALLEGGPEAMVNADVEYVLTQLLPVVKTAQILPTQILEQLDAMTRGGDVEKRMFAFETLEQLSTVAPEAFDKQTNSRLARDVEFYSDRKELYPAEELMNKMQLDPAQSTLRAQMYKDAEKIWTTGTSEFNSENTINGALDPLTQGGFFGVGASTPSMPVHAGTRAGMEKDALVIFKEEYARDGDAQRAQMATQSALTKLWGVTNIGGSTSVMRYPPEQSGYVKVGGNYDWIDKSIRADLKIPDKAVFQLISDDRTRNESIAYRISPDPDNMPSYRVVWFDDQLGPQMSNVRWYGDNTVWEDVNEAEFDYLDAQREAQEAADTYFKYSHNARNHAPQEVKDALAVAVEREKRLKKEYDDALKATE